MSLGLGILLWPPDADAAPADFPSLPDSRSLFLPPPRPRRSSFAFRFSSSIPSLSRSFSFSFPFRTVHFEHAPLSLFLSRSSVGRCVRARPHQLAHTSARCCGRAARESRTHPVRELAAAAAAHGWTKRAHFALDAKPGTESRATVLLYSRAAGGMPRMTCVAHSGVRRKLDGTQWFASCNRCASPKRKVTVY